MRRESGASSKHRSSFYLNGLCLLDRLLSRHMRVEAAGGRGRGRESHHVEAVFLEHNDSAYPVSSDMGGAIAGRQRCAVSRYNPRPGTVGGDEAADPWRSPRGRNCGRGARRIVAERSR